MKHYLTLAFLLLILGSAQAQKIRRLLLFADDSTNVQLITQRQLLEAQKQQVEDRDIWIAVFTDPKTFRRMYDHYGVGRTEFYMILIDKDGTEKLRSEEMLPVAKIFESIDAPLDRQADVQNKDGG